MNNQSKHTVTAADQTTMDQQVMLKRVALFFGNAVGNAAVAMITAVVVAFILVIAEVSWTTILIWLAFLLVFVAVVLVIEVNFDPEELTHDNASKWLNARMAGGSLVALMYGLAVFLLPAGAEAHFVMYLVLILITIVSLCATGFAVMPNYTYLISLVTILPMLLFLLVQLTPFYFGLAFNMLVVWGVLINKARLVSVSAIEALVTNEKLQIEIHNHKQTQRQLDHMTKHDYLTGLPNRKYLLERMNQLLGSGGAKKSSFVVMFLDLDGFKAINDVQGHTVGDWLLQQVAGRLQDLLDPEQMVARIGGDEFIVLADLTHAEEAQQVVDRLKQRIEASFATPITLPDDQQAELGVSIGVMKANQAHDSAEAIIQAADWAMYQNKKAKKNR